MNSCKKPLKPKIELVESYMKEQNNENSIVEYECQIMKGKYY